MDAFCLGNLQEFTTSCHRPSSCVPASPSYPLAVTLTQTPIKAQTSLSNNLSAARFCAFSPYVSTLRAIAMSWFSLSRSLSRLAEHEAIRGPERPSYSGVAGSGAANERRSSEGMAAFKTADRSSQRSGESESSSL